MPLEFVWKLFESFPPSLVAGKSATLKDMIARTDMALLRELKQVITGGGPAYADLAEIVKTLPQAKLLSVYGQTETGICFVTEYDKRDEGYVIPEDVKVEVRDGQLYVNDFETGDNGSINEFGKIDLGITRIGVRTTIC